MLLSKLPANLIAKERIKSFAAFLFEEIAFNTRTGSRPPAGFGALAMSLSKKTLLAMLVGATLTSLYGCGGDDSGGGDNMPPADEPAPEGTYDEYKCIRFEEDPENLTPEWSRRAAAGRAQLLAEKDICMIEGVEILPELVPIWDVSEDLRRSPKISEDLGI